MRNITRRLHLWATLQRHCLQPVNMFLLLLLPCHSVASVPLPNYMLGTFQPKDFTNYMYKVGVDWFTRKIAAASTPRATWQPVKQSQGSKLDKGCFSSFAETFFKSWPNIDDGILQGRIYIDLSKESWIHIHDSLTNPEKDYWRVASITILIVLFETSR